MGQIRICLSERVLFTSWIAITRHMVRRTPLSGTNGAASERESVPAIFARSRTEP